MRLFDWQWVRSEDEKNSLDLIAEPMALTLRERFALFVRMPRLRFVMTRTDLIHFYQTFAKASRSVMINTGLNDPVPDEMVDDVRRSITVARQAKITEDGDLAKYVGDLLNAKGYMKA